MAKPRNDRIDYLQYLALRVVHMMMHCWPVQWNLRLAQYIGDVLFYLDAKHRKRAMHNLTRSFPHYSQAKVARLARESMRQTIMLFVEVLFTTRLIRIDTFTRHVRLGDFRQTLGLLMDRHRGLIMLTGHYGNWEILGYVLATLGFPTVSVARPLDNPYVNQWLLGVREKKGQRIVDKKGATQDITRTLEQHGTVAFIADQNAGPKGIFVDFFGRKASTYKSIGLLAMQYDVPIIIGYARRIGTSFRFEVGTQDIIYPQDWKNQDQPLYYITQRYTKAIENFVSAEPGQYLWIHRRWKTRPKGEAPEQYD
ncbi:MAG: lipid A biosynthesis lauroyl acyltransferase [Phycisphaerae bacterium]|jgi:KDO2-lipid IV(A) lauroyltransferase|nr:MAG: lipid A biosynthesis lauroyl acyltransferase [Phycisphaerae bacterium]